MDHKFFYRLLCLFAVSFLTPYMYRSMLGTVPLLQLNIAVVLGVGVIVFWALRLFWKRMKPAPSKEAGEWIFLDRYNSYAFYISTIWAIWFVGPYLPAQSQLVCVFFLLMCSVVIILGSLKHAPAHGFGAISPLLIPAAALPFILLHMKYWNIGVAAAFAVSIIALFAFRYTTQNLLNANYYARLEAERQRDAKNRFIASASHDLQQPIQAASLSFDQVVSRDGDARDNAVRRVRWALDTTGQLLNRMTDHLQLESGKLEAKLETVAIGPAIARAAELYEPAASANGAVIHAMPSTQKVQGDAALIDRVLANLITNAIKHAGARRILIGARRISGQLRIWVIDDGTGIGAEDRAQLFDDYIQGTNHGDEIRGGFGLGLGSAQRMAGLMNGRLEFEPQWQNGAAFMFELPAG